MLNAESAGGDGEATSPGLDGLDESDDSNGNNRPTQMPTMTRMAIAAQMRQEADDGIRRRATDTAGSVTLEVVSEVHVGLLQP